MTPTPPSPPRDPQQVLSEEQAAQYCDCAANDGMTLHDVVCSHPMVRAVERAVLEAVGGQPNERGKLQVSLLDGTTFEAVSYEPGLWLVSVETLHGVEAALRARVAELELERDRHRGAVLEAVSQRVTSRIRSDYPLTCEACGSPHWFDTSIASDLWNQIADPSSVLCLLCIDERFRAAGLQVEAEFYFGNRERKGVISKLYEESHGDLQHLERDNAALRARVAELERERASSLDRDFLGQLVRVAWVAWAKEQPNPKPSWLLQWTEIDEVDREADRRIGEYVAAHCVVPELLRVEAERDAARRELAEAREDTARLDWLGAPDDVGGRWARVWRTWNGEEPLRAALDRAREGE